RRGGELDERQHDQPIQQLAHGPRRETGHERELALVGRAIDARQEKGFGRLERERLDVAPVAGPWKTHHWRSAGEPALSECIGGRPRGQFRNNSTPREKDGALHRRHLRPTEGAGPARLPAYSSPILDDPAGTRRCGSSSPEV